MIKYLPTEWLLDEGLFHTFPNKDQVFEPCLTFDNQCLLSEKYDRGPNSRKRDWKGILFVMFFNANSCKKIIQRLTEVRAAVKKR